MTEVAGLTPNSPFADLVGDLHTKTLLTYVHGSWVQYAEVYKAAQPSLQKRSEPQLTQALGAYLRKRHDAGEQPFPGDFHAERSEFVLDKASGLPRCISRTDIEWRLYGVPAFVVEFKVLNGQSSRRQQYLFGGVSRFVVGRYGSTSPIGAMFALLRKMASKDPALLFKQMKQNAGALACTAVTNGSKILPGIAMFDSSHNRRSPHISPIQLAHLFVALPN